MVSHLAKVLPLAILILISADNVYEIPSQLIALQILMNIAMLWSYLNSEAEFFCLSYKNTVLAHLTQTLDHPSFQIRQMAAIVRNNWFVINN